MRALLALLALALLVAGCGGGESAGPSTAPARSLEPVVADGLVLCEEDIAEDALPDGDVLSGEDRITCLDAARFTVMNDPTGTYPSALAPDGDWTARELLEWIAQNARPQTARAAQEAIGSLPGE